MVAHRNKPAHHCNVTREIQRSQTVFQQSPEIFILKYWLWYIAKSGPKLFPSLSPSSWVEPSYTDCGLALALALANGMVGKGMQTEAWKVLEHRGLTSCHPWDPCNHCQVKNVGQTLWVEVCDLDTSVAQATKCHLLDRRVRPSRSSSPSQPTSDAGEPSRDQLSWQRPEQSSKLPKLLAKF